MRGAAILGTAFILATWQVGAQVVTDVPLPPNLPTVVGTPYGPTPLSIEGIELFAEHDALAFFDGATIHSWTGLPFAPAHASIVLPASQRFIIGWKIARDVLAYWSVGPDLQASTADDRLCMIRGLPYAPQVVVTQIGPTPGLFFYPFSWVRTGCAVTVTPSGFWVLLHDANGATVQPVPVPGGLPLLGWGAVDGGTVCAYAGGSSFVMLRGLAGAGPYTIDNQTTPGVGPFSSFLMSADGVGVGVSWTNLPTVHAHVVQVPPLSGPLTVTSFTWTGPTSSVCSFPCAVYQYVVAGGGLEVRTHDDGGSGFFVLGNLRQTPIIKWSSGYVYTADTVLSLSEDEIVSTHNSASPGSFDYTLVTPGGTQTVSVGGLADHAFTGFERLGRGALAYVWNSLGGTIAQITLVRDATGATATSTSAISGRFTRTFSLGGAAVAAFIDTSGTPGFVSPTTLRIVSAPRCGIDALANPAGNAPVQIALTPSLGSIAQGVTVAVQGSPSWPGPAVLYACTSRLLAGAAWAAVDGLVLLDASTYFAEFAIPLNGTGSGQLAAPPGSLPPALSGVPIYCQAAIAGGGVIRVSDLSLVILGP